MDVSTIGHSTHSIEVFIHMLQAHGIRSLVDVRTIPKSRRNPQFSQENLAASLQAVSIDYRHLPGLGGLRHPRKDSMNTGWRNASFRGYADYMQTPEFDDNLRRLLEVASEAPTAIMCAEAVPWRCHRSLIADAFPDRRCLGCARHFRAGDSKRRPGQAARYHTVRASMWRAGNVSVSR